MSHPCILSTQAVALYAILAVAALGYAFGLTGPFVFDDVPNISENTSLLGDKRTILEWWSAAQSSGAGAFRRPIAVASFAAQLSNDPIEALFSLKSANVFIHLMCGVMVFYLARVLCEASIDREANKLNGYTDWLPITAAAVWLLNPLFVSTTLYVVQRMAQLSTLFTLAGLLIYSKFRLSSARRGSRPDQVLAAMLWILLCGLLAVLSKENGVLLPWLIAVVEICFFYGRWNGADSRFVRVSGFLAFFGPLLLFLIAPFYLDWISNGYNARSFSMAERIWTEIRLLWSYTLNFIFPRVGEMGLFHDDYVVSTSWRSPLQTATALGSWVVLLGIAIALRRKFPWLLFAALFFLVGHSLESTYLALELAFEHRNYLPTVGVAILVGAAFTILASRIKERFDSNVGLWACGIYITLLWIGLLIRATSWSSEAELARALLARHPDSPRSSHMYANHLLRLRQADASQDVSADQLLTLARHEFEIILEKHPRDLSALVMLYTLDSRFYSDLSDPSRWLPAIEARIVSEVLQPTDYAAMRVLTRCVLAKECPMDASRFAGLLEAYFSKVPPVVSTAIRLEMAESMDQSLESKQEDLEEARLKNPVDLSLYYSLVSVHIELEDYAAAHKTIEALIALDPGNRELASLDKLF